VVRKRPDTTLIEITTAQRHGEEPDTRETGFESCYLN